MVTQTRDGSRAVTGDRGERNSKTRGPETQCAAESPCQAEEAVRRSEAEMEPLKIIETDRVCKGRALAEHARVPPPQHSLPFTPPPNPGGSVVEHLLSMCK